MATTDGRLGISSIQWVSMERWCSQAVMYFAMAVSPVVFVPEPGVEESIWTRAWVRETTSSIVTSWVD